MRDHPNISVIGMTDLSDQPRGKAVFITEGLLGLRQAFYVDRVRVSEGVVTAEKHIEADHYIPIIQVPINSVWGAINAEYVYTQTYREALEKRKKAVDDEQEMAKAILGEDVNLTPASPGAPVTTLGNYL